MQGVKYQLFYKNGPKDQTSSAATTVRQSYGLHVLDSDDTETARAKIETEIRRLPTATWEWENRSEENELGDLRVWQVLPGESARRLLCEEIVVSSSTAVRNHPRSGQPAFFNNVVSRFLIAVDNNTLEPPHITKEGRYQPPAFVRVLYSPGGWHGPDLQQYGDGSLIPNEYLESAVEIIKETRALVTWTPGDVLLIDVRTPLQGDPKI